MIEFRGIARVRERREIFRELTEKNYQRELYRERRREEKETRESMDLGNHEGIWI